MRSDKEQNNIKYLIFAIALFQVQCSYQDGEVVQQFWK